MTSRDEGHSYPARHTLPGRTGFRQGTIASRVRSAQIVTHYLRPSSKSARNSCRPTRQRPDGNEESADLSLVEHVETSFTTLAHKVSTSSTNADLSLAEHVETSFTTLAHKVSTSSTNADLSLAEHVETSVITLAHRVSTSSTSGGRLDQQLPRTTAWP
ncbi:hypothetical protein [Micropruina sp.]|uniref:hypothetical protein n=1 Tax=Micropruina sp. TaxID=2737536 RepID=UPI0039E28E42